MKFRFLYFLIIIIVLPCYYGCSTEKQTAQRRNLMMPQKDELPRNSKYTGTKKRKTYKPKKKKKNRRRGYSISTFKYTDYSFKSLSA